MGCSRAQQTPRVIHFVIEWHMVSEWPLREMAFNLVKLQMRKFSFASDRPVAPWNASRSRTIDVLITAGSGCLAVKLPAPVTSLSRMSCAAARCS